MQLLLDTQALLWWLTADAALSAQARKAIADGGNNIYVSAASAWEIATKHRLGKLSRAVIIAADVEGAIKGQGFVSLPITVQHGQAAGSLPGSHRDPFDRMLIAQALLEKLVLVTNEKVFESYGISRLW